MASPRRQDDQEQMDYRSMRGGGVVSVFNGHTKWVVGAVGTLLITSLLGLAARDRMSIDTQQMEAKAQLKAHEQSISVLREGQATILAQQSEALRRLQRIEDAVDSRRR